MLLNIWVMREKSAGTKAQNKRNVVEKTGNYATYNGKELYNSETSIKRKFDGLVWTDVST